MPTRLMIAYSLIALMVAAGGWAWVRIRAQAEARRRMDRGEQPRRNATQRLD